MVINGAALKAIRVARGETVTACAAEVGVSQGTWSNWESNTRNVDDENLTAICRALDIQDVLAITPVTPADLIARTRRRKAARKAVAS